MGTLEHEGKEKQLEALVRRIEEMPGCLRDYRIWLQEKGIDATNMGAMGSAGGDDAYVCETKQKRSKLEGRRD
ncbi:UPF0236 family transposase-like protein [Anoxybacillus flavithermus]|uniref:UPF0236 family transposase-like protein n=1 Tax=Anoxybacillus flavithermus TaxID=33934 RepID=UPI0022A6792B|nr:UPF0236 family protein [Anoxybacillus flavithermus]